LSKLAFCGALKSSALFFEGEAEKVECRSRWGDWMSWSLGELMSASLRGESGVLCGDMSTFSGDFRSCETPLNFFEGDPSEITGGANGLLRDETFSVDTSFSRLVFDFLAVELVDRLQTGNACRRSF
jgi:hypothetical protein